MKTIKEYWILTETDPHRLSKSVQEAIYLGAQPYGSMVAVLYGHSSHFYQPMVKYAEEPPVAKTELCLLYKQVWGSAQVQKHLDENWKLYGMPFADADGEHCQILIKEESITPTTGEPIK